MSGDSDRERASSKAGARSDLVGELREGDADRGAHGPVVYVYLMVAVLVVLSVAVSYTAIISR